MQVVSGISYDEASGASIWILGQEEPVIIQPFHPSGGKWISAEEALKWAKEYAAQAFGYIEVEKAPPAQEQEIPEPTEPPAEPVVTESTEEGTSEIIEETAE